MLVVGDHTAPVLALAFAPDGRLASGSEDGSAYVWDLSGGPPDRFIGHVGSVGAVAVSPDGRWLATGGADRTAKLWHLTAGSLQLPLPCPQDAAVTSLTFFHNGRMLAIATGKRLNAEDAGEMRLVRVEDRSIAGQHRETHGVWTVAATPQGKTVAWAGGSKRATVWDITAPDRHTFPPHKTGLLALALSPDGRTLATTDDWGVRLFDVGARQERATLAGHKGKVCALAFAPDGATLLSAGWDKRVILWDTAGGRERQRYDWPIGRPRAVAFSTDGLLAAAGGDSGRIVVWDVG